MQSEKGDVLVCCASPHDPIPDAILACYGNKAFLLVHASSDSFKTGVLYSALVAHG